MDLAKKGTINVQVSEKVSFDLDEFRLDGVSFKGIGHEMLKTQNQLNYVVSPGRQTDGSMKNINSYDTFILPKVEIGFGMIDYDTFKRLRKFLLAKRTFQVEYYDKDFNKIVKHEMYAEPDELTAFFNLGYSILGSRDFKVSFIATLNETETFAAIFSNNSVDFSSSVTEFETWGRNITIPDPPEGVDTNGWWAIADENGVISEQDQELKFYPKDQYNIIATTYFVWKVEGED